MRGRVRGQRLGRRLTALVAVLALVVACSSEPGESPTDESAEDGTASVAPDEPVAPSDESLADPSADPLAEPPSELSDRSPGPTEPEPPPPPASREALLDDADRLLDVARSEAGDGELSVLVVDEHGREVLAHEPDAALLPASTLKIVTAAAALVTFGPDAQFRTRVEVTAPVTPDGVVDGDLVLVGSGDPVLATPEYGRWVYPARPRTPLENLADAVVDAGILQVRGDLLGAADRFEGPSTAEGWPDRYFSSLDARYADGLSVDAGLRTILSYPEPEASDELDGGDRPDATGETGEPAAVDGTGETGETVEADGSDEVPDDVDPIVRVDHAADPAAHAAAELARLLDERGVVVRGEVRSGAPEHPIVGRVATVASPPLDELLRFAVQRSDNQLTDALFRAVGRARTGTGSFVSGDRALRQVLDALGVDHAAAQFADGSGLSRNDRATARLLVGVDRAMQASRHARTWQSFMAVTGVSGTLRTRLQTTAAEGRFAGKTGTLQDVSGLVGTVTGRGPRRYHLAVVANGAGPERWVSRQLADELILRLVADLDGDSG